MRKLAMVLVLAGSAVLSAASATQQQAGGGAPYGQDPTGCDVACGHYFQCKGINDGNAYGECVYACQQQNPDPNTMYAYAQMDCQSAVAVVEQGGGMQTTGGGGGGGGGPRPGDKECQGCKRWDDLCQYVVETAVGSGPYSGMVTECAQSCCP